MTASDGKDYFMVMCCGKRRGLINNTLVCGTCDFDHGRATVIPNEWAAKDVPQEIEFVHFGESA